MPPGRSPRVDRDVVVTSGAAPPDGLMGRDGALAMVTSMRSSVPPSEPLHLRTYLAPSCGRPRDACSRYSDLVAAPGNPYLDLTEAFNRGRRRALVSSGQAVVLHRLAIMSKDGDWVLREDEEALRHVLDVLASRGARYRFGAPLDVRWLAGGWSAHFEHSRDGLRLRTDFVTRPPRLSSESLERLWGDADASASEVVSVEPLVRMKMTMREKDYAVIGELARLMADPRSQLLYSRSSRDLIRLARTYPDALGAAMVDRRPVLARLAEGRDAIDEALDRERRLLMRADEERLASYRAAAGDWGAAWSDLSRQVAGLPLLDAHRLIVARAEGLLPYVPAGENA
jgi:hypothetical protein